jgi:hypothetical protein
MSISSAPDGLRNTIFYTTNTFDLGQQIQATQSYDGFLGGDSVENEAFEDPFWSGTSTAGHEVISATSAHLLGSNALKRLAPEGGHDNIRTWWSIYFSLLIIIHYRSSETRRT